MLNGTPTGLLAFRRHVAINSFIFLSSVLFGSSSLAVMSLFAKKHKADRGQNCYLPFLRNNFMFYGSGMVTRWDHRRHVPDPKQAQKSKQISPKLSSIISAVVEHAKLDNLSNESKISSDHLRMKQPRCSIWRKIFKKYRTTEANEKA